MDNGNIEKLARVLCAHAGEDPDGPTLPHAPVDLNWQAYVDDAKEFVASLSAAGLEVNKAGELARKDEALRRQAASVRTLRHHEDNELNILRAERTQAHQAIGSLDSERDMNATLTAELERLTEALTPSCETKAAYMSEVYCDHRYEDEAPHFVPWDSIKAIMSMIQKRAARTATLTGEG